MHSTAPLRHPLSFCGPIHLTARMVGTGPPAKQGPSMHATAIILAAGLGTRMKSALPKTLHRLAGRTMLRHLLASCESVFDRIVVVLGPDMDAVRQEAAPHICVVQPERLGTAHAALQAAEHFGLG